MGKRWEQAVVILVVATVCFQLLAGVLPRLVPAIVVVTVAAVVVRLVFFHTRRW